MALTAIAIYASDHTLHSVLLVTGIFALIGLGSSSSWALAGSTAGRWLADPRRMRVFNAAMALLLVGSIALAI
jgi:threonine/homoserine/homoserine lactone efflux protein